MYYPPVITKGWGSFKTAEIELLREALKQNFNLETSIHKKRKK